MTAATPDRRPWHRGVDRRAIADASLRILDEDGLDALTMRAVASAVGVEAASLYAHVTGKAISPTPSSTSSWMGSRCQSPLAIG